MTTEPLDLEDLVAALDGERDPWTGFPPGTRIGHIHLHVSDLLTAERFYHGVLGFQVVLRSYPGALFLSAGGYHHHAGLNTWAGRGAPPPPADAATLVDWELVVPDADASAALLKRLRRGLPAPTRTDAGWRAEDPDGTAVVIREVDGEP